LVKFEPLRTEGILELVQRACRGRPPILSSLQAKDVHMKQLIIAAVLGVFALAPAYAADGAALYKEKTCSACHGATGTKPLMPDYPKVAGQNAKYLEKQMHDIKSGARANGNSAAMKGVMHLVSDAEITAIADYLSKLKP
jgi:cytochrome c